MRPARSWSTYRPSAPRPGPEPEPKPSLCLTCGPRCGRSPVLEENVAEKTRTKATPRKPRGNRKDCSVEGCKRPYRAKSFCFSHYRKWRRGEQGTNQRFKTCGKEDCKQKVLAHGLCTEHQKKPAPTAT